MDCAFATGRMASTVESYEFLSKGDEYNTAFDYFSRGRQEQQQLWIVDQLIPKISGSLKNCAGTWRVLAVGPGNGPVDLLIVAELVKIINELKGGSKPMTISWTVVEPNETAMAEFKRKVEDRSLSCVRFEWINKTFDEFMTTWDANSDKFHLVHFVHCLYYMQEDLALKTTMEQLLEPNGHLLVVVGIENDVWDMLMKGYKDKIETLAKELHYLTNTAVIKHIGKHGWKYETFIGKLDLEITEIFEDDHPTGVAMLQFFMHTKQDARKCIEPQLIKEIVAFLRRLSWAKKIEGKEKIFVNDDEGVILISNSQ